MSAKGTATQVFPVMPFAAGFKERHSTDAHTCCYAIRHLPTGQFIPDHVVRMSKPGLALIHALRSDGPKKVSVPAAARELLQSIEPMGTMLLIDLDNENHQAWSPVMRERAQNLLTDAAKFDPIFGSPSLFHTTRGGLRLVWLLSEPVPVEGRRGLEDLLCGLIMRARQAGLEADASCGDWTRLFRLPLVTRETKDRRVTEHTWFASSLAMSWGRIDFAVQEDAPANGQVLVHSPQSFRGLSEYQRIEIESGPTIVKTLGKLWDKRLERDPGQSVTTLLDIETGKCPDAAQVSDYVQRTSTDEDLDYKSIKAWVKSRAYPSGKHAVPEPAAKYVWEQLYGGASLIDDPTATGQLHANLLTLTQRLAWVLRQRLKDSDVTPQMLYLLTIQAAKRANERRRQAGAEARAEDELEQEVWRAVESAYRLRASEQHAFEQQRLEDEACAQEKALLAGRLRTTMEGAFRSFLMGCIVRGTQVVEITEEDRNWIEQNWEHLLVLETPDGFSAAVRDRFGEFGYSHPTRLFGSLLAYIRDSGLSLVEIYKPPTKPTDPPMFKTLAEIQHQYGSTVGMIKLDRSITNNQLQLVANADRLDPALNIAAYGMRTDIEPIRDRRVEQWLAYLGGELHEKLLDWLATYTMTEYPSAGLYIQGSPSIGKGMLGRALTQMTQARHHGKLEHVMQQFQDSMFATPFIWGDEESNPHFKVTQSMMNLYKKLVSGEFDSLNPKGSSERSVKGYWRVYLSANGDKYLKLTEDVNEADLQAIIVRTLHLRADSEACIRYLGEIGGAAATKGWPEHNIPCHVAWLQATRQVTLGARFAVEGVRTDYHDNLSFTTNSADITLRTIAVMLDNKSKPKYDHIYQVRARRKLLGAPGTPPPPPDWRVFIRPNELHAAMVRIYAEDHSVRVPSPRHINGALHTLSGADSTEVTAFDSPSVEGKQRAWAIPLAPLFKSIENLTIDLNCRASIPEAAWQACATKLMREAQEGLPPPKTSGAATIQFPLPVGGISPPKQVDTSNQRPQAPVHFPGQMAAPGLKQE